MSSIFIRGKSNQSGDTLVEVLLATVILSVVLASSYTLSNRATRINQQAFERTQITNLLQQQAELVRSARDSYIPTAPSDPASVVWATITSATYRQSNVAVLGAACDDLSTLPTSGHMAMAFNIDDNFNVVAGIVQGAGLYNIWTEIEAQTNYWNVSVFGCWEGLGANPTNVTSIVLRLDDPR